MGDTDIVERMLVIAEVLDNLEPWQENEREVGHLLKEGAEMIILLREDARLQLRRVGMAA